MKSLYFNRSRRLAWPEPGSRGADGGLNGSGHTGNHRGRVESLVKIVVGVSGSRCSLRAGECDRAVPGSAVRNFSSSTLRGSAGCLYAVYFIPLALVAVLIDAWNPFERESRAVAASRKGRELPPSHQ
jgi:hypothetical protein